MKAKVRAKVRAKSEAKSDHFLTDLEPKTNAFAIEKVMFIRCYRFINLNNEFLYVWIDYLIIYRCVVWTILCISKSAPQLLWLPICCRGESTIEHWWRSDCPLIFCHPYCSQYQGVLS